MARDDDRRGRDRDDDRRGGRDRDRDDDRRGRDRDRDDRGRDRDRDDRGGRDRDRDDRGRDDRRGGRDRDRDDDRGSGSSSRFQYRSRSADEVKERSAMGAHDYDKLLKPGIKMWKPNDGENRIRLLPATWDGAKHYGLDVYVHYGVGPDRASYICPVKHDEGKCPVCEEREEAQRDNDPDEKYVKDLEAKRRVLVYLVDRDNEREGVQAWFMPWTLDKDITKISVDRDSGEVLPVDHPEDGYDVTFDKTGSKDRTKYEGVSIARRPSPLGKAAWLDFAMDEPLPEQLNFYDYDTIAKAFGGKSSRSRDDRDDDRGRDRDDDRGRGRGRDDDRGRDRDRDDRGGRDRDRDDRRGGRDREEQDAPTWASVHDMTRTEMEDLIELHNLPIKPREAKDDEDLADWICEEMKLEKSESRSGGGRSRLDDDPPSRDSGSDRLREMRERRRD